MANARATALFGLAILFALTSCDMSAEPKQCAGIAGFACGDDQWCDLRPGLCATPDADGVCIKLPEVCGMIYQPVCGCDGKTYGNDCQRQMAKVSKRQDGPCP
jgi:hypothetical protein